jgi:hypothetical protein
MELSSRVEAFDVAHMSAHDIWHSILLRRDLCGGMLTRTVLIAASTDSNCLPLWCAGTQQEKNVLNKKTQGTEFIQHFTPNHKIAWLRMKLFNVVVSNRTTYSKIRVTFNGHTSISLAAAGAPELTIDLRCRIAHLALEPLCQRHLLLIFGSRDSLEKVDNKALSNTAVWTEIARLFVNNPVWQPFSPATDGVSGCESIDCTLNPPSPGLDGPTIQDVFLECRQDWTRLKDRVFGQTGSNSTGAALLKDVWLNYINGGKLKFTRPKVAMYIFTSWLAVGKKLPELCNRQLRNDQQLRIGVGSLSGDTFKTPEKPPAGTPGASSSTRGRGRGKGNQDDLQQPLFQIAQAVQSLISRQDLVHATPSSNSQSINTMDAESPTDLSAAPPKSREGVKRAICVAQPDTELSDYLAKHKITKLWPEIYDRLGITSIDDLKFIGRAKCEQHLTGLPVLPIMRLAALAES